MTVPGPHVFGDGRLGCWIVNLPALPDRLAKLRALGFTDLFLHGPTATADDKRRVRAAGFATCSAWWAVDSLDADTYATRTLSDIARWSPAAGELNIELPSDAELGPYIELVHSRIRRQRPQYRLRINVAARKTPFLPADLLTDDEQLYACEQVYADSPQASMAARLSEADALDRAIAYGIPRAKFAPCYAGAVGVGGRTGTDRVNGLPNGWLPTRGVVFHDDLLAEAGLL